MIHKPQEFRIFPTTFNGDRVRVIFRYEPEAEAFELAVKELQDLIAKRHDGDKWKTKREERIPDFQFSTSLSGAVVAERLDEFMYVVGLGTCNTIDSRGPNPTFSVTPLKPYR